MDSRLICSGLTSAVLTFVVAEGCGGGAKNNVNSTPSTVGICSAAQALNPFTDSTGRALADAYSSHATTADQRRTAVAFLILLADGLQSGTFDPILFETDILQSLGEIVVQYPSTFQTCTLRPMSPGRVQRLKLETSPFGLAHTLDSPGSAVDCNQDCGPSSSKTKAVVGEEAGWKAVEYMMGGVGRLAGLKPPMVDAYAKLVTTNGKVGSKPLAAAASDAVTSAVDQSTADQILENLGNGLDVAGIAENASVLLNGTTATKTFLLQTLGTLEAGLLLAKVNVAVWQALDDFVKCVQKVDEACSFSWGSPFLNPFDLCRCSNGTLDICVPPCAPCVDPYDPSSCRSPLNGGNPIDDGGNADRGGEAGTPCGTTQCASGTYCNLVGQCLPEPLGGCATLCGTTCCPPMMNCQLGSCLGGGSGGAADASADDSPADVSLPDPCGVAGTWTTQCDSAAPCGGGCTYTISASSGSFTISPDIAANGGSWSDSNGSYTFDVSSCSLTHTSNESNPCFSGAYSSSRTLRAGSSSYGTSWWCWDLSSNACECTGTRNCTATKSP